MAGINTGILINAYPLTTEQIKALEERALITKETFAYLDDTGKVCFTSTVNPESVKDFAWHNAYELISKNNILTKKVYIKQSKDTFRLEKLYKKTSIEDAWEPISTEGNASGSIISLSDVSPIEHTLKVKLRSKNLLTAQEVYKGCYMYEETTLDERNVVKMTSGSTIKKAPIQFQENTQYTVSFETKSINNGATGGNMVFTFFYTDGTYSSAYSNHTVTTWKRITATSTEGKTISHIGVTSAQWQIFDYIDIDTFQFEIGTTATAYTPFVDVSSVSLQVGGKNLCNPYDFVLGQDWNNSQNPSLAVLNIPCLPNTSYAISWSKEAKTKVKFIIEKTDTTASTSNGTHDVNYITARTITTKANTNCICILVQDANYQNLITYGFVEGLNLQIERDTTATDYEPYREPVTYTPNADGTVDGVKSISPNMVLSTDTYGVVIDVEYNRDISSFVEDTPVLEPEEDVALTIHIKNLNEYAPSNVVLHIDGAKVYRTDNGDSTNSLDVQTFEYSTMPSSAYIAIETGSEAEIHLGTNWTDLTSNWYFNEDTIDLLALGYTDIYIGISW